MPSLFSIALPAVNHCRRDPQTGACWPLLAIAGHFWRSPSVRHSLHRVSQQYAIAGAGLTLGRPWCNSYFTLRAAW